MGNQSLLCTCEPTCYTPLQTFFRPEIIFLIGREFFFRKLWLRLCPAAKHIKDRNVCCKNIKGKKSPNFLSSNFFQTITLTLEKGFQRTKTFAKKCENEFCEGKQKMQNFGDKYATMLRKKSKAFAQNKKFSRTDFPISLETLLLYCLAMVKIVEIRIF